jgi:hypothetical protein
MTGNTRVFLKRKFPRDIFWEGGDPRAVPKAVVVEEDVTGWRGRI